MRRPNQRGGAASQAPPYSWAISWPESSKRCRTIFGVPACEAFPPTYFWGTQPFAWPSRHHGWNSPPTGRVVRILDITSPRLVGQALYEQIRWAETCIVDWTYWRANVFFELGVRLACFEIGPVCLLDEADPEDPTKTNLTHLPDLTQKSRLKELLRPTEYQFATTDDERVAADKALTEAIGAHEA